MTLRISLSLSIVLSLSACSGGGNSYGDSTSTTPTHLFEIQVPEVDSTRPVDLCEDVDGDGFGAFCLQGDDCDDSDPSVNPSQIEVVYDGVDNDCNAATLDDDLDRDGYVLADDCDDDVRTINPGRTELCNNDIDDDCDEGTPDVQEPGIATCPFSFSGSDCRTILQNNGSQAGVDGFYAVSSGALWCDMTTESGGWSLALVVSDDGVDSFTYAGSDLLSGDNTAEIGDIFNLTADFKSWAYDRVKFTDIYVVHEPSQTWAVYGGVSDGTGSFGAFVGAIAPVNEPVCYDSGVPGGFPMTAGNLAAMDQAGADGRRLCSTDLYFNVGDHETGDVNTCLVNETDTNQATYGLVWNQALVADGDCDTLPFNDPSVAGIGPSASVPNTEAPALGFAEVSGLNVDSAGDGAYRLKVYLR